MHKCTRFSRQAISALKVPNNIKKYDKCFRALSSYSHHPRIPCQRNHKSFAEISYSNSVLWHQCRRTFASGNLPDHVRVVLPALSPTMEKGTIVRWSKQEGDHVSEGDLLAEIETDKATMGLENSEEGYIAKILIQAGTKDVPIGTLACIIVRKKEDVGKFADFTPSAASAQSTSSPQSSTKAPSFQTSSPKPSSGSSEQYPKYLQVSMPGLSPTMTKGNIKEWLKKEGDKLKEGDVLVQIETDKATMDFETPEEGYLACVLQPSGSKDIDIGKPLCVIVYDKAHVDAFKNFQPQIASSDAKPSATPSASKSASSPSATPPSTSSSGISSQPPLPSSGEKVPATPMAKRVAQEKGINLQLLAGRGSGLSGAVTAQDVLTYASSAPSGQPVVASGVTTPGSQYSDIDLSNMRKVIAKRLLQSKTTIPHYYLTIDVNMDKALQTRQDLNSLLAKDKVKLSVNDFIIKASALACMRIPEANSSWQESFIRQYHSADINVAVATDAGLITPIVFQAERKGLVTINREVAALAQKAREGKLQPQEFQGGTFTISNLGMFGIKNFAAVINPPQACILAVGRTEKRFIADEHSSNGYKPANMLTVTLSCDHRVVDGAVGAQWLAEFRKFLERPEMMLL